MPRDRFCVLVSAVLALGLLLGLAAPAGATPNVLGSRLVLATPAEPRAVAIGDLNGDGHPDIAVACDADSFVALFFGHGDGTFTTHATATGVIGLDSGVIGIGAGARRVCALTANQGAKCWGSAPLGDGTTTWGSAKPVGVLGLP